MQPDEYVLLGAALALQIAEGLCDDELEAAAALYTVIGDQLALIAVARTLYAGACAAVRLIYAVYMHCCVPWCFPHCGPHIFLVSF